MKDDPVNRLDSRATLPRRTFLKGVLAGGSLLATGGTLAAGESLAGDSPATKPAFRGPNVVLVRFGGGARRKETIDPQSTYSPFLCRELVRRGTLFKNMEIAQIEGVRSEEHTSELQSPCNLVCRLLLEKKKDNQ